MKAWIVKIKSFFKTNAVPLGVGIFLGFSLAILLLGNGVNGYKTAFAIVSPSITETSIVKETQAVIATDTIHPTKVPMPSVAISPFLSQTPVKSATQKPTFTPRATALHTSTPKPTPFITPPSEFHVILNTSSKTFHLKENCSAVVRMLEANKDFITVKDIQIVKDMGYKACGICAKEYKD